MIRDVVVHMNNEQPLVADLRAMPTATDACLVCTNMRAVDGKKPTWIDQRDSWFLIPLAMVRFVEVPKRSAQLRDDDRVDRVDGVNGVNGVGDESGSVISLGGPMIRDEDMELDPELDEDLLRRVREA